MYSYAKQNDKLLNGTSPKIRAYTENRIGKYSTWL